MSKTVSVAITQQDNYQFLIDFGENIQSVLADELAPLGEGKGPAPTQLLMASVANCLAASFFFSLGKFKQDAGRIQATATCEIDRNDQNRLRVQKIDVEIKIDRSGDEIAHMERILEQFEAFCTVTQSIEAGVPVHVGVTDGKGVRLK